MGRKKPSAAALLFIIMVFELSAFVLLSLRVQPIDLGAILFGVMMVGVFILQYALVNHFFPYIDRYILIIANMLAAVGLIVQYRLNPEIAFKQAGWLALGMIAMVFALLGVWKLSLWQKRRVTYIPRGQSILLLALTLLMGRSAGGRRNVFRARVHVPALEFVKLIFVAVLAAVFAQPLQKRRLLLFASFAAPCSGFWFCSATWGPRCSTPRSLSCCTWEPTSFPSSA